MHPSAKTAGGRRVTRWTRESIITKILEWNELYGEPPCSADWNPSLARWRAQDWRADRYREGNWPSTNAAKRPFGGSFDAAVRAAGVEPHRSGPRRRPAGTARPAVEQRAPMAPRSVDEALLAAAERSQALERRVAALERAAAAAERRAARAEDVLSETRTRARRAADRERRARIARQTTTEQAEGRPHAPHPAARGAPPRRRAPPRPRRLRPGRGRGRRHARGTSPGAGRRRPGGRRRSPRGNGRAPARHDHHDQRRIAQRNDQGDPHRNEPHDDDERCSPQRRGDARG